MDSGGPQNPKCRCARQHDLRRDPGIVPDTNLCWMRKLFSINSSFHTQKQFQEVTVSGFSTNERVEIGRLIEMHGGTFVGQMSKTTCTHLISANNSGEKYRRAKDWGTVQVVSLKWLNKCIDKVQVFLIKNKFQIQIA